VWKVQVRALVQHYLYDLKLKRVEAAADRLTEMEKAMRLAVGEAIKAKTRASAALIIAVGAMVAAMAGALSRSSLCGNMVASRPGPPGQHSSTTPISAAIAPALPKDAYVMRLSSVMTHGKTEIGRLEPMNTTEFPAIGGLRCAPAC